MRVRALCTRTFLSWQGHVQSLGKGFVSMQLSDWADEPLKTGFLTDVRRWPTEFAVVKAVCASEPEAPPSAFVAAELTWKAASRAASIAEELLLVPANHLECWLRTKDLLKLFRETRLHPALLLFEICQQFCKMQYLRWT